MQYRIIEMTINDIPTTPSAMPVTSCPDWAESGIAVEDEEGDGDGAAVVPGIQRRERIAKTPAQRKVIPAIPRAEPGLSPQADELGISVWGTPFCRIRE